MWGNQGGYDNGFDNQQGGGGYVNSPGFGSPMQSTQGGKAKRAQNLIPCTIAQVLTSSPIDEGFRCGEVILHQVSIVGLIRRTEMAATHITYELDDMSGPTMEVRQWLDNDENAAPEDQPQYYHENTYVKIIGNIRSFSGKQTVSPFKITPLRDLNEVTMHMLEVTHAHMLITKKKASMNAQTPGPTNMMQNTPTRPMQNAGNYGATPNHGLNNVQTQVHQLIVACPDEQGISLQQLRMQLKGISIDQIRNAVEFLSNEGHIYSTIDDDHFKSTEA